MDTGYNDTSFFDNEVNNTGLNFSNSSRDDWNVTGLSVHSRKGATIVSPVLMFMTGLIGNTLALIVLYRTKTEIRRTMFYTLVAGLAWTDITGQVLTSPVSIYTYINGLNWAGGERLCKFNGFIMGCFGLSTPCLVCAMAVERFLALKCPYFYSKYCTRSSARVTILLLWGIVLLVSILPLMGFGEYSLQYPGTWCFLNFHTSDPLLSAYGYIYAGLNLVIIVIMTGCNIFVGATLLRVRFMRRYPMSYSCDHCQMSPKQYPNFSSPLPLKKKQQHAVQMQMIWLMCAITTVFAVCWAPLMVQIVKTLATGMPDHMADLLGVRLASINQILDPWLYILVRRTFLQKIARCCSKAFCYKQEKSDPKLNRATPKLRIHPPSSGEKAESENAMSLHNLVDNDIVGLYTPCPHCANKRRREGSPNLNIPDGSNQKLPDVMGSNDSRYSDHSSLPDVTPEGSNGRPTFSVGPNTAVHEIQENPTSGYYDTESEPIYVDVFLLPRERISQGIHVTPEPKGPETNTLLSQNFTSVDESSVFVNGTSTSGVFSWNNQAPRRPFLSVDANVSGDQSPHKQQKQDR